MPSASDIKRVLLALPSGAGIVNAGTAVALIELVRELTLHGIDVDVHNIDAAEIVTARDMFANMLYHTPAWDALLFVDSDMAFRPELFLRMIAQGGDVVAAACPRRILHLDRLVAAARQDEDLGKAVAQASDFAINHYWESGQQRSDPVVGGFCRAAAVGMACAVIRKSALIAMVDEGAVEPRLDLRAGADKTCWSFFGNLEHDGARLGEDYSFCYRWTSVMDRDLWVCVDEAVTHIGYFNFTARYSDLLKG